MSDLGIEEALQRSADLVAECNPCGYFAPNCAPPGCVRKHELMVARIADLEQQLQKAEDDADNWRQLYEDAQNQLENIWIARQERDLLYCAVNLMMAELCVKGEINTHASQVEDVMGVLHDMDGGVFNPSRCKELEGDDE